MNTQNLSGWNEWGHKEVGIYDTRVVSHEDEKYGDVTYRDILY